MRSYIQEVLLHKDKKIAQRWLRSDGFHVGRSRQILLWLQVITLVGWLFSMSCLDAGRIKEMIYCINVALPTITLCAGFVSCFISLIPFLLRKRFRLKYVCFYRKRMRIIVTGGAFFIGVGFAVLYHAQEIRAVLIHSEDVFYPMIKTALNVYIAFWCSARSSQFFILFIVLVWHLFVQKIPRSKF